MRIWSTCTVLAAAGLLVIGFASAPRTDQWVVIGPGGGGGHFAPTISPHDEKRVLMACDMTGSFLSKDGGDSWRMFNLGNRSQFFVFDPVNPRVIYAKTIEPPVSMRPDRPAGIAGLWRSEDEGKTWRLIRADPKTIAHPPATGPAGDMTALAVDPTDSHTLYTVLREGAVSTLYISKDWGKSWESGGELADAGQRIYVDPHSPAMNRTLYVMGTRAVMIREGGRWRVGAPLASGSATARRTEPADFSAGFPQGGKPVVYACTGTTAFVSEDGGQSWRPCAFPGPSPRFKVIATGLRSPDTAYLSYDHRLQAGQAFHGVAKTTDRGRTWTLVWNESQTPAPNILDAWLSERFGPGWGGSPFHLEVAPENPELCYGTDYGRAMRTTDGGKTWKGIYSKRQPGGTYATTGLDVTTCYGVHFDPFDPQRIFISYTDAGLFRSHDRGKTWASSSHGVPEQWVNTTYWIAFDPEVKGLVWGAMSGAHDLPRTKMFTGQSTLKYTGGICRSTDGGATWSPSNAGMPETATTHVLLDPKSPKDARVLYATGFARGVFKSVDNGARWTLKNRGIAEPDPFAWRLAMDSRGVLYLVVTRRRDDGGLGGPGDGALYRSEDGAENWSKVSLPAKVNGPHGLAIDPKDPQRLYLAAWGTREGLGTFGGGIYLSTDRGGTWRNVLDKDQHVYDITLDPRNPATLYASGFESSAWRSDDRGETWRRLKGFNFKWGHRVIPDPADRSKIYITTYGGSVWHGPASGDDSAGEDTVTSSQHGGR